MFKHVPNNTVVLRMRGVYKAVDVYSGHDDRVYVPHSSGFITLGAAGATSRPGVEWVSLKDAPNVSAPACKNPAFA